MDKAPINTIYTSNKISRVENLKLEIVSTGNVQGKKCKRKATVLFTTTKEGDKFITDYTIKSYDKN